MNSLDDKSQTSNPTLDKELDSILLQFIAEYHQGLNELAGHGTAIDQAKQAIKSLILEGRINELQTLKKYYGINLSSYVHNRINQLKAKEK